MKVESTTWTAVDDFISDALIPGDAVLEAALADSATAGLPAINVTAPQGRLLQILAQTLGARRSSRSARSAATARSGWRARCRRAAT